MIRIITDSSSDITREEAERLGIELVALHVAFGEESFLDGVNITHDEFYKRLEEAEELPKTSQMNPAGFVEIFEKFIDNGDEIVGIFLSSKLGKNLFSCVFILTKSKTQGIINIAITYGEVAQLARASGSYPAGRRFESHLRYQIKNKVFQKRNILF